MGKRLFVYYCIVIGLSALGSISQRVSAEEPFLYASNEEREEAERVETILNDTDHYANPKAQEVVLYALGLLDIGYRFGGKNPEAGLDCSGMVSYVYTHSTGYKITGSAADLAKLGYGVPREKLAPGDLVFFNTLGRSFSHVGIYIGENRFIHAPNSRGRVRIDRLDRGYFSAKFESARTLFG